MPERNISLEDDIIVVVGLMGVFVVGGLARDVASFLHNSKYSQQNPLHSIETEKKEVNKNEN